MVNSGHECPPMMRNDPAIQAPARGLFCAQNLNTFSDTIQKLIPGIGNGIVSAAGPAIAGDTAVSETVSNPIPYPGKPIGCRWYRGSIGEGLKEEKEAQEEAEK